MKIQVVALCALAAALPVQAQFADAEFRKTVQQLIEHDDIDGLSKLFKRKQTDAWEYLIKLHYSKRRKPDEVSDATFDAFLEAWRQGVGTRTVDYLHRYMGIMSQETYQGLIQLEPLQTEVHEMFLDAKKTQERSAFDVAIESASQLARTYEEYGHALFAARSWALAGEIANSVPNASEEDRETAIECMRNFVQQRKNWDWTSDPGYVKNKAWLDTLVKNIERAKAAEAKRLSEGYSAGVSGPDAMVLPNAEEEIAALEFAPVKKPYVGPFALGGGIPALWLTTKVNKTGPSKMKFFSDGSLYIVRPAANKWGVTSSGEVLLDKNPWQKIKPSPKFKASTFYRGDNKTKPYALWFYTGGEGESIYGTTQNLAPGEEHANLYYRSASSWTATLNGEKVTFFDDNVNGVLFEEDPLAYGLLDQTRRSGGKGAPVPAYDCMQVGKGPTVPVSAFTKIGDTWFHLRSHDNGQKAGIRELSPEYFKLGNVELKWKGSKAKLEVLVIEGRGDLKGARYDLASAKALEVPVGKYELSFGRVATGKGARRIEAHVSGGLTKHIVISEGKTTTVTLGAPFHLDFEWKADGDHLEVEGTEIAVYGAAGERYSRINGAPPAPVVLAAKKADGKGAKPVGEFVAMDSDRIFKAASHYSDMAGDVGFFAAPKDSESASLVLRAKMPFESPWVGLREKKNKLFGKLESEFKPAEGEEDDD